MVGTTESLSGRVWAGAGVCMERRGMVGDGTLFIDLDRGQSSSSGLFIGEAQKRPFRSWECFIESLLLADLLILLLDFYFR